MKHFRWTIAQLFMLFYFLFGCTALAAPVELSLDDCITLGLKSNADMNIAQFSREKSAWAVKQAEAEKGFTLNLKHTDERYDGYNTAALYLYGIKEYTWTNNFDNTVSLSLPIYTGKQLESQIDEAKLNFKVSDLNVSATKQTLRQRITTEYFTVLQYLNNLQVSKETVANYTEHLKNVQAQYDVGTVAKSDVLASEVSLANAEDSLVKAQNSYEVAVATLDNDINLPLDSELKLKDDLKYEQDATPLDACSQYALHNRPELAEYQAQIDIAKKDITIADSGYRPTIQLEAEEDWYDENLIGDKNNNWLVGLTASWNVFDSGLTKSKVKQANYGLDTALEQFRQERDTILLEVRQYYLNMHEAEKRIGTSNIAVDQAKDNLRIAEIRYAAGVGTNLDVLDAVLALNQAKVNYIQAMYDYNTSKAQLDKAMGVPVK